MLYGIAAFKRELYLFPKINLDLQTQDHKDLLP
jgi:hypothetical protein